MNAPIRDAIKKRFPNTEYAYMEEVRNAAGHAASRSADAVLMGLWPSRGLRVHGIEVKISRGDWQREMKQPAKAEAIYQYCDYWWLVTGDDSIAKLEEIPATWGWLAVKGGRLVTMKEAPSLEPVPLARGFIACMLRRATEGTIPRAALEDERKAMKEKAQKDAEESASYRRDTATQKLDDLEKAVKTFEEASGVSIRHEWRLGEVGAALKQHLAGVDHLQKLTRIQKSIENLHTDVGKSLLDLSKPAPLSQG